MTCYESLEIMEKQQLKHGSCMYLFYSYEELFPFQTSITPNPPRPPPPPLPGPLSQHTAAPPSLATSAVEPLAPNAGTTSWKSAPAARIISPCKTTRLLCSGSLPSPPPAIPPPKPPPTLRALVRWADLLTARLDTHKLVDNGSQTRWASVSISSAEIASPRRTPPPPAALTYLTGPQSFKQGQLDLLSWTEGSLVTTARNICLSVYSR